MQLYTGATGRNKRDLYLPGRAVFLRALSDCWQRPFSFVWPSAQALSPGQARRSPSLRCSGRCPDRMRTRPLVDSAAWMRQCSSSSHGLRSLVAERPLGRRHPEGPCRTTTASVLWGSGTPRYSVTTVILLLSETRGAQTFPVWARPSPKVKTPGCNRAFSARKPDCWPNLTLCDEFWDRTARRAKRKVWGLNPEEICRAAGDEKAAEKSEVQRWMPTCTFWPRRST